MKGSRFTEEQIIGILREQEAGVGTAEVCRKHGISQPTFDAWKAKFGGLSVSDAKRLKQLEDENARLKKLLAEAMLDNAVLKDITSRKWWCLPLAEPWLPLRARRAGSASDGHVQSLAPTAARCAAAIGVLMTRRCECG
jgi:putative transposase